MDTRFPVEGLVKSDRKNLMNCWMKSKLKQSFKNIKNLDADNIINRVPVSIKIVHKIKGHKTLY